MLRDSLAVDLSLIALGNEYDKEISHENICLVLEHFRTLFIELVKFFFQYWDKKIKRTWTVSTRQSGFIPIPSDEFNILNQKIHSRILNVSGDGTYMYKTISE